MSALKEGPRRKRLYIVGQDMSYYGPFAPMMSLASSVEEAEVALFTGGADVSPELYGEKNYGHSGCDPRRDEYEVRWFKELLERKIPMIGICRGAQFLTAMSGGRLWQHVENHGLMGTHPIETDDGREFRITSTHHQMMRPQYAKEFHIIAWTPNRSKLYIDGTPGDYNTTPELKKDPEIVWYPQTRSLCIQGHPEYMPVDCDTSKYCRELVEKYVI